MTVWRGVDYGQLSNAELFQIVNNPPKEVYFIRCEKYVKIGASKWPPDRLKQIRWGTGGTLVPPGLDVKSSKLVTAEPGGITRERELHIKFSHLRHTGEWFTETPELTEYIESLTERSAAA